MRDKVIGVFNVANQRSIAWAVARRLDAEGAQLAIGYLGDREREQVEKLVPTLSREPLLLPCDVTQDEQLDAAFRTLAERFGRLDGLFHAIAFARREDLEGRFTDTSREGFWVALNISVYSLVAMAQRAESLMKERGGSIVTMTYLGGERAVPHYNVMGVAKAALESSVRYLARELGPEGIRVNAISAGPIRTLAARGIPGFSEMYAYHAEKAPLRRHTTAEEVADVACFLLGDLARGITGEVIYVDEGYHILGL
jgi:enoyl-[acyl-carrier protein] reductase I